MTGRPGAGKRSRRRAEDRRQKSGAEEEKERGNEAVRIRRATIRTGRNTGGFFALLFAAAALTALDQLTKQAAVGTLGGGNVVSLIPGVLELTLVWNRGAAFGLGEGAKWLFLSAAVIIGIWIVFRFAKNAGRSGKGAENTALVLLLAGAAGNAIDRFRLGCVIDFIYVKLIDFPVFNVADICVTAGCALLLVLLLRNNKK